MSQSNTIGKILSSGKKINGNRSIGIGFNLDRTGARTEWEEITENLEIIAPASEEQKSLSWFIRFGGGRSIVLR